MIKRAKRYILRKRVFNHKIGERNGKPPRGDVLTMRALILLGLISLIIFLFWFFKHNESGVPWLYWLLTSAMLFKILRWLHEWYHYFNVSTPLLPSTMVPEKRTVDMFTTYAPGEPLDMVVDTLRGMIAISYPHSTYLCDECDHPYLRSVCQELGVIHVTREKKVNAKAGNINNALQQATGEIVVILDPDHKPLPQFLDKVLPFFEDPQIGFVQIVQAYGN